ncbi:hypothetical protein D3C84_952530 [compost metagenome]
MRVAQGGTRNQAPGFIVAADGEHAEGEGVDHHAVLEGFFGRQSIDVADAGLVAFLRAVGEDQYQAADGFRLQPQFLVMHAFHALHPLHGFVVAPMQRQAPGIGQAQVWVVFQDVHRNLVRPAQQQA